MQIKLDKKTISVIVPAYNEEKRLGRTLARLKQIRAAEEIDLEIIVAVRESKDRTHEIACRHADVVVEGGPVCQARNNGAAVATGDVLIFLDADTVPNFGTISKIARAVKKDTVGTCTAYPSRPGLLPSTAIALHNLVRATHVIKGLTNLLFVHRSIVHDKKIVFDPDKNLGEHHDFIRRARKQGGGTFQYLRIPKGYEVSVDRYERQGYLKSLMFWVRWFFTSYLIDQKNKQLEKYYWSH